MANFVDETVQERKILMWQVQKSISDEDIKLLKHKGVNVVQSFAVISWKEEEIKKYLDRMNKENIGVIVFLGQMITQNKDGWIEQFDYDKTATFINKWKNHPAIYAWYVFDEPSHKKKRFSKKFQEDVYNFLKKNDPEGKVFLAWNGVSDKHYDCCFSEKSFDILEIHAHFGTAMAQRQINLIQQFKKHRLGNYPVIISIRCFNGPNRGDMPDTALQDQYDFFFKQGITKSLGIYGWQLGKNEGIREDAELMKQFNNLNIW